MAKIPKPNKQVLIDFIINCLKEGEPRNIILAKVVLKCHLRPPSSRTVDRWLKIANIEFKAAQIETKKELAKVDLEMAVEERKRVILTAIERKELLTQIALGEVEIPTLEAKWDPVNKIFVMIPFVELPTHQARIKAVEELNKMDGDYAATKQDIKITKLGADLEDETYV